MNDLSFFVIDMPVDVDSIQIDTSWKEVLHDEFQKSYFTDIKNFLLAEKEKGQIVYPKGSDIFHAFNATPFDQVKVAILGQDPYHGEGEAHGLCFSVQPGIKIPPSLRNIFKELKSEYPDFDIPQTGELTKRAKQGVFLLNAILTAKKDQPASHKDIGRAQFTDAVIKKISDEKTGIVFLLRGAFAQSKEELIDTSKHFVLKSSHPSPFSANRGFFGNNHFVKTNDILVENGNKAIDWTL